MGKKTTAGNQNEPCRNICLGKFQVKGDYFLPERFDLCEEIFNGVLKCSPVVGFKCRGLSNIQGGRQKQKNHKTTTTTKIGENKPKTETHKTKRKPKTEKHYQKTETQIPKRK